MKGDDLEGLGLNELQQLEKTLETGLTRVIETKVRSQCVCVCVCEVI